MCVCVCVCVCVCSRPLCTGRVFYIYIILLSQKGTMGSGSKFFQLRKCRSLTILFYNSIQLGQ